MAEPLMKHIPHPGQQLRITNLDYIILSEEWIVLAVEYPTITFSCKKWWDYNSITMQGQTSETVIGNIVTANEKETIIAFMQYSQMQMEVGLVIRGSEATYLKQLDPPKNA
jgi:hypothetical protein